MDFILKFLCFVPCGFFRWRQFLCGGFLDWRGGPCGKVANLASRISRESFRRTVEVRVSVEVFPVPLRLLETLQKGYTKRTQDLHRHAKTVPHEGKECRIREFVYVWNLQQIREKL